MTRDKDSPWSTAVDFVPEWSKEKELATVPQNDDEMIASMAAFFGCGPGKPN
jgi:hypothetical protein